MTLNNRATRAHWRGWLLVATAVLLLAAAFRLLWLADVPPGLAQDEVLDADIALFIRGGEHALFFHHGYGHEPLYHYYAVPFQALLGDNILSIRLPAAFLGLLLVALTMRWARRDFGSVPALVAGLGLAVSWWPIIFSRIGIRPILEPVLLTLAVIFWQRRPWLAGLLLGLTLYSYTAARVLLALPLLFALYWWLFQRHSGDNTQHRQYRAQIRAALIIFFVAVLVCLPLGYVLWTNPDLQQRVEQLGGPLQALRQGDPRPVLEMTAATLGVFSFTGDPRWTYTLPGRPLFDPLTAILFYGGLLLAIVRWRRPRYAFLLLWLAIALIPSAVTPDAPSTVRLVGAMPVIYLLPGLAVQFVVAIAKSSTTEAPTGHRPRASVAQRLKSLLQTTVARSSMAILLVVLLILNIWRTTADGFLRWPADPETRLRYQSVLQEIGRYWQAQGSSVPVLAEVFFEPIDADSFRRTVGRQTAARWVQTGAGVAGAVVWPAGQEATQTNHIYVPEYAPLDADLMSLAGIPNQPVYRSQDSPSFAAYHLPDQPAVALEGSGGRLGQHLTLLGYALLPVEDGLITIVTYWQVEGILPADLSLFAHQLDSTGQIVTQHDGLDAAATTLLPGDRFLQRHLLPLTMETAESQGERVFQVGAYTRGDGRRLLVTNCDEIGDMCARAADAILLDE